MAGSKLDALRRAYRRYPDSRSFQSVYLRGAEAAICGRPIDMCPYARGNGWSNSRRAVWRDGYMSITGGL